jgi:hypothetical protein
MLPTETVGVSNNSEGKNADTEKYLQERLPVIKCVCGAEILLLPDLHAMTRAIKAHVSEHRKNGRDSNGNANTYIKIDDLLSQLSLRKIIEQNITLPLDIDRER